MYDKPAILGGEPVRLEKIYYGKQWINEADIQAVNEVLRGDYLTTGPHIEQLEKRLVSYTGAKYGAVCSSGTAALHLALLAAGIVTGDEVIVSAMTFIASANAILYCGAIPVFADIDESTYNIDPENVEKLITDKTKAVLAVDYTGEPADLKRLSVICHKHGLILIEDAAHSIGAQYEGKNIGSIADLTTFSFHPVKTITGGEGGAVMTNNYEYYRKVKLLSRHGVTYDESEMQDLPHEGPWVNEQIMLGYNYRITDMQCALIMSQLDRIEMFVDRRRSIAKRYDEAFGSMPQLIIQKNHPQSKSSRQLYLLHPDFEQLSCSRKELYDALDAEGIRCMVHYVPVYLMPYYRGLGYQKGLCPEAERLYNGILSIPCYPKMSDGDVEDVIRAVEKTVRYYTIK